VSSSTMLNLPHLRPADLSAGGSADSRYDPGPTPAGFVMSKDS
jgi:hypothetical protein